SPEDGLHTLAAWMPRTSRAPNPIIFGRLLPDIRRRTRSSSPKRRLTGCLTPSVQQGKLGIIEQRKLTRLLRSATSACANSNSAAGCHCATPRQVGAHHCHSEIAILRLA